MAAEVTPVIEKVLRPNEGRQTTFFSLPDSIFEALYGGAAGGGKSWSLLVFPLFRGWHNHPKFHGIILRRTFPELEEYMILRSKEFYEPIAGRRGYNEQQKRWRFPSGAVIKFGHAEEEQDIRKYDTAEYNYIAFDELTSFTEFQYRYLAFSRARSSTPDLPAIVRSATNPGNVGHGWCRKRFVEPAKEGCKILAEELPDGRVIKRIFIPAKVSDNPHITENDPLYASRMYMLPEAERIAKLEGDWWTFSGQVFAEFRTEPFKDEPPEARHVIDDSYEVPSWIPTVLAIDWGFQAMTYASWGRPFPNRRAVVDQEYAEKGRTVKQWANDIAMMSQGDLYPDLISLDPSAWQQRGNELTIAAQFEEEWKRVFDKSPNLIKADNDRIGGKMLVHDYLRWQSLPKVEIKGSQYSEDYALSLLQTQGLLAYKAYLAHFSPKSTEPEVLPRLLIKKRCKVLIDTIPKCVYNTKLTKKNIEDVAEFDGDDPYDQLRYLLKALEHYYETSKSEEGKAREKARVVEVCQNLQQSGDMTKFYRQMEKLEYNRQSRPVARIGSRRRRVM